MKRKYSNDNITVFWDSDKCIHSGKCDGQLPQVFDPRKRPWVNLGAADVETIKRVIDTCPSGALSYQVAGDKASETVTVRVINDGPYKVTGACLLIGADGEAIDVGKVFSLCRCGASGKMPFCDGSHYTSRFRDKVKED